MAIGPLNSRRFGMLPMLGLFVFLLISLSYMSDATHNSERFGQMYSGLLMVNAAGLIVLGALVVGNVIWLIGQRRQHAAGARMTTRLVVMFVVLAVAPVTVVYYFSLQFLQRGIDSWFDARIEQGLDDAMHLSRAALDVRLQDVLQQTGQMRDDLEDAPAATMVLTLYDLRVRSGASELALFGHDGRIIASSSVELTNIVPSQPTSEMLLLLQEGEHYIGLDPATESGLFARALVPVQSSRQDNEVYILQALYPVSKRFETLASNVEAAFARYRELAYLRTPLKFSYTLTLSIVLVLSLLAAIWAAFQSARRLVAPIRDLAEATHAVAEGDYSKRLPVASEDELGFLVRSFNDMTRRLTRAREQANRSQQHIEGQRAYLEAVLANLSSGVISLDADLSVRAVNRTARKILGVDVNEYRGKALPELVHDHAFLKPFVDVVMNMRSNVDEHWREEVSLFGDSGRQLLTCRGTALQADGKRKGGMVIVFDDVTALIQAQRDAAWGEVARRLAHEIKNPLTPIQLSAERLRHRYLERMDEDEREILDRATRTIVNQVEAMKKMVNAFSEYARIPQLSLNAMDLNQVVREVLDLYRSGKRGVQIEEHLDSSGVWVEGDAGRLRQLMHNLVKNALEAVRDVEDARVIISTQVVDNGDSSYVQLSVEDNGPGFDPGVLENVFEPYVSTKPRGGGLGLAIVKKIVEEHGGMINAETGDNGGARVRIRLQRSDEMPVNSGAGEAGL